MVNILPLFLPSLRKNEVFSKEVFEDLFEVPFEHLTLPAPKQYDAVLNSIMVII